MWTHTRDIVILFSRFTKYIYIYMYILWIWHLLQFMTTEFKLWLEIDSASLCLWRIVHSCERPRKEMLPWESQLLPASPTILKLPRNQWEADLYFLCSPSCKGAAPVLPIRKGGDNGSCKPAFTYFNCFHIHTCAMHKHPYVPCFSHTVKREGMLCTSFFLNATLICSQAKDILLYTM